MKQYPFILATNHIVTDIEGTRTLIDTGSPTTLGIVPRISIAGLSFPVETDVPAVLVEQLQREIGTHVDVLLGCDVMRCLDVAIDPSQATVTFHRDPLPAPIDAVEMDTQVPFPVIPVTLQDKPVRAIFDTGARISYIDRRLVNHATPLEMVHDFHISLGRFTTPIYQVPLAVGDARVPFRFGVLPEGCELGRMLAAQDIGAVIGSDLLRPFVLSFSLRQGWLKLT